MPQSGSSRPRARAVRRYPVEISQSAPAVIDFRLLIEAVAADLWAGQQPSLISSAFHRWVADVAAAATHRAHEATGTTAAAVSGGVFQNRRLVELLVPELEQSGFEVLRHRQVPPNDGGISLGQAAADRAMLASRG